MKGGSESGYGDLSLSCRYARILATICALLITFLLSYLNKNSTFFMQDIVTCLERCRVPVIAAVHGLALGGAVHLITTADMCYVTDNAKLSMKEVSPERLLHLWCWN